VVDRLEADGLVKKRTDEFRLIRIWAVWREVERKLGRETAGAGPGAKAVNWGIARGCGSGAFPAESPGPETVREFVAIFLIL